MLIFIILLIVLTILFLAILFHNYRYNKEIIVDRFKYTDILNYDIQEIPNFLTHEECNKIIELSNGKLFPSKIYTQNEDLLSNDSRISQQCWLTDDNPVIKNISERIKQFTNTTGKQEQLQVVNYPKGGFFSPHYDACEGDEEYCSRMNSSDGPRLLTVLLYLNDNFEGGETVFPKINKSVKPEKGKAVIFRNVDKNGVIITQALHGGEPIKSGEKWIANKWIRIK
jgi:prolyl 4-hydroxylase